MFCNSVTIFILIAIAVCCLVDPNKSLVYARYLAIRLRNVSSLKLGQTRIYETSYNAEIIMGNPGSDHVSMFDLTTADIMVMYQDERINSRLPSLGFYNGVYSMASQFVSRAIAHYEGNRFDGYISKDEFAIISDSYRHTFDIKFFVVSKDIEKFLEIHDYKYDSIIGLSPSSNSTAGHEGFLASLKSKGWINELQFSISFRGKDQAGKILLGATDKNAYHGELNLHEIVSTRHWALNLSQVILGSKVLGCITATGCRAILSTTLKDIYGPAYLVDMIHSSLGAMITNGLAFLPIGTRIENLPDITLNIDGIAYTYPPVQYVNRAGNQLYLGIIADRHSNDRWILGRDFLSMYYTAYDLSSQMVGIARMRHR